MKAVEWLVIVLALVLALTFVVGFARTGGLL